MSTRLLLLSADSEEDFFLNDRGILYRVRPALQVMMKN
jgi:hypothetical protein